MGESKRSGTDGGDASPAPDPKRTSCATKPPRGTVEETSRPAFCGPLGKLEGAVHTHTSFSNDSQARRSKTDADICESVEHRKSGERARRNSLGLVLEDRQRGLS